MKSTRRTIASGASTRGSKTCRSTYRRTKRASAPASAAWRSMTASSSSATSASTAATCSSATTRPRASRRSPRSPISITILPCTLSTVFTAAASGRSSSITTVSTSPCAPARLPHAWATICARSPSCAATAPATGMTPARGRGRRSSATRPTVRSIPSASTPSVRAPRPAICAFMTAISTSANTTTRRSRSRSSCSIRTSASLRATWSSR